MTGQNPSSHSIAGWKGVAIAVAIFALLLGLLYLAANEEPDYMKKQKQHSHQMTHNDTSQTASTDHAMAMEMSSHDHSMMSHDMPASQPMEHHHQH